MLKNNGRVINITSIVGHSALVQSKLSISYNWDVKACNRVCKKKYYNKLIPGFIETKMTEGITKVRLTLTSRIPMARLGTGEDVSTAYFSLDLSSYITEKQHMLMVEQIRLTNRVNNLIRFL